MEALELHWAVVVKTHALRAADVVCVLAGLMIAVSAGGCNDDPLGRHAISGSVKVDGQPLASGNINFDPVEGQATSGGAIIRSGRYVVPQGGGLVTGKYRVSIHAPTPGSGEAIAPTALPGDAPHPPSEWIPRSWNTDSEHFIDVRKQGPFVFDFDVPIKNP